MGTTQVFVVEDEGIIAADVQERLTNLGYTVASTAATAEEALARIPQFTPDVVLMDIVLQGSMDGIEAAQQIREKYSIPVVFLTAHADEATLMRAKVAEPFGYILKPFEERELQTALETALHRHKMEKERAKTSASSREELEKTMEATVKAFSKILSVAEPQSYDFSQKLKDYVNSCCKAMNLENAWELEVAASLCRIGYATTPPILIQKMRAGMALAPAEKDTLMKIPEAGKNLLATFPKLENVARIVYFQNKNFDGTGFPMGIGGGSGIPMGARLLKILIDVIGAEAEGSSKAKAFESIRKNSGAYDPKLLEEVQKAVLQSGPKKGRKVPLKDLAVGQVLVEPIESMDGTLILNAGNTISPWMLKKLHNFVEMSPIKEPIYVEN